MITATKTLVAALLLSTAMPMVSTALAGPPADMHSLSGAGYVVVPADFFYPGSPEFSSWSMISVHQKADGTVQGTYILNLWFDSQPNPIVLASDITCLTVDGNTAWFSGVISRSNDLSYAKPGDEEVGFVTDTHGDGPDIFWSGPSVFFLPPGADCTAKPAMLQYLLTSGNFVVR